MFRVADAFFVSPDRFLKNFEKLRFNSNCRKIMALVLIFSKISKNLDFSQSFEKIRFGQIFKNFDFGQRNSILVKF